jgi:hypothetical protein
MGPDSYQAPEAVYLAVYLKDMTEEAGPTQLVPASHRDLSMKEPSEDDGAGARLSSAKNTCELFQPVVLLFFYAAIRWWRHLFAPAKNHARILREDAPFFVGAAPHVVSFTTRAQDVVVWDQRAWHRRGPGGGGAAHPRINAIFGFNSIQTEGSDRDAPYPMHPALARAWLDSADPADQLWFGGKWSPDSICFRRTRMGDAVAQFAPD